jgi:hypothetical protein
VAEEEVATAAAGKAEAEARPGSPEAALPRIYAAGRRGKEEE